MAAYRAALTASTALIAALSMAGAAFAQEAATEVEGVEVTANSQVELAPEYAGDQVARGGRVGMFGALDYMDTPYATTSYTEDLVRDQQARSVADVLQNDPAVRVAKGFGNFQELYVIRGFPVFSDDMTWNGVYGILPRQFVAAELIERAEVFHGANTFLNGAAPGGSGVGGAFNLAPKRAPDEPLNRLTVGAETGGQLYGAADLARRFGEDGEWGLRLNVAGRDGETSVEGQDRGLGVVALGLDRRGERFRFTADIGYQDHHIDAPRPQVTPLGAPPSAPDADTNYAQPWTYTDETQLFGVVRGEFDFASNVTAWAAIGGRSGEERNVLANPSAAANGSTTAYRFDNAREDSIVSADAGLRAKVWTGPVRHTLVASVSRIELQSKNAYAFSDFFTPFASDLNHPVDAAPPVPNFFIGGVMSDPLVTERTENQSAALADMMSFMDGRLIVTAGVRWQDIETRSYDYNTGGLLSRYASDAVTPAFAVVFKPNDTISLYANYSQSLVPGQIAPALSGGVPVVNAGEVLAPFRAEQYEAGVKLDTGSFGGSLSVFSLTLPSAFVQNNVFGDFGEQTNQGVELSLFGEPVEGLRLLGGATFIDAELSRTAGGAFDGQTAIGVPDFTLNANIEWDVPQVAGLTLEGRVIYTGEQYIDAANAFQIDDSTRIDLGARFETALSGKAVTLRARVENVADDSYWASAGGYPGANYLVQASPRTFIVSASVDF